MKILFTGKNIEVTESLKEVTEKKFQKLEKFLNKDVICDVFFTTIRNNKIVEVTIRLPKTIIRAEESTDDMYTSIDKVVDVLERQIRKHKTKLEKRYKNNETIRFENIKPIEPEQKEDTPKLVKNKRFNIEPMDEEEATLQMELLRHNFFVFINKKTEDINIIYKRRDGNYGLIEVQN